MPRRAAGIEQPFKSRWASTPVIATPVLAARTGWTIRSSAPRPIWRRGCNRSPSPAASSSVTNLALASDGCHQTPLPAITMKGISREVIPIRSIICSTDTVKGDVIVERVKGWISHLDPSLVDPQGVDRIRSILSDAQVLKR